MSKLILDATVLRKLLEFKQPVEVCDQGGHVVGHFFPRLDPADWDLEPEISEAEIERRSRSNEPTYTTAEVLAHLEKL